MRSLALSLSLSSSSVVLNLLTNSFQSIFPSPLVSTLFMIKSISLELRPRLSFLIAFLNSMEDMNPFPSSSNFLKMSSKLRLEDLTIWRSFSMISASHYTFEELIDTIVVRAPGFAWLTSLTVEKPEKAMFSKCDLKMYLSMLRYFPP